MLYLNMIEANELRIGNWFKSEDNNLHQVNTRNIKYTDGMFTIPLTEEILLKCGFIKKQSTWSFNEIEISSWFTFKFSLDPLKVQELNYLHQLQNLYFALTSKELEVNFL